MFRTEETVLFRHCDPAGIVFYPRYFEMVNDAIEVWFAKALLHPWDVLHETHGTPTVHVDMTFHAPSRHGDVLNLGIQVQKLGRSSVLLKAEAKCDDALRFVAQPTLVFVDKAMKATEWPEVLRQRMRAWAV